MCEHASGDGIGDRDLVDGFGPAFADPRVAATRARRRSPSLGLEYIA